MEDIIDYCIQLLNMDGKNTKQLVADILSDLKKDLLKHKSKMIEDLIKKIPGVFQVWENDSIIALIRQNDETKILAIKKDNKEWEWVYDGSN